MWFQAQLLSELISLQSRMVGNGFPEAIESELSLKRVSICKVRMLGRDGIGVESKSIMIKRIGPCFFGISVPSCETREVLG